MDRSKEQLLLQRASYVVIWEAFSHLSAECEEIFSWNVSQLVFGRLTEHWWHFQGRGFKGQGHRQYVPKMYFSVGCMPVDGLLSKPSGFLWSIGSAMPRPSYAYLFSWIFIMMLIIVCSFCKHCFCKLCFDWPTELTAVSCCCCM